MTLIALEEHVLPADLINEVWSNPMAPESLTAKLVDVGEQRLPAMDEAGIDMQVLSVAAPGSQQVSAERAVHLSRALNDRCAEVVAAHPVRFNALATLPTQDPDAAIVKAQRAITELGFCGVVINGHTQGRFLDAPEFDELLAAIEELDVPIYLHPTYPPPELAGVYFSGLPEPTGRSVGHRRLGMARRNRSAHIATRNHRHLRPTPQAADRRRTHGREPAVRPHARRLHSHPANPDNPSVAQAIREHVHITICGYTTTPPLLCALQVFGADRIMFSSDYPFGGPVQHANFLAEAPISPADRDKIAYRNAQHLFRL